MRVSPATKPARRGEPRHPAVSRRRGFAKSRPQSQRARPAPRCRLCAAAKSTPPQLAARHRTARAHPGRFLAPQVAAKTARPQALRGVPARPACASAHWSAISERRASWTFFAFAVSRFNRALLGNKTGSRQVLAPQEGTNCDDRFQNAAFFDWSKACRRWC